VVEEKEGDFMRLMRILVPVDFSPPSQAAVEEALFLAKRFGASLDLLHVWQADPPTHVSADSSLSRFALSDVGPEMRKYLERAEAEGVMAIGRLASGQPEAMILECAGDYDLIVMGTRGRGAVSHLIEPSLAEHIVRRATVPVLTIHAPGAPATVSAPAEAEAAAV
jgi:nucleotide-binding universal stress UspA family protein